MPRSDGYRGVIQTAPLSSVQQRRDVSLANNNLKSASALTLSSSHKRTGSGSVIDPMDDLMEIDFTSSPGSSVMMEEDVCDSPTTKTIQYSSSPLAKSRPMSVPTKRSPDDHHHVISTGSRGIDPPNGYVPMRPTMHTSAAPNSYMLMNPVVPTPYSQPSPSAPIKTTPSVASSPSSASTSRNNNSMTASDDYLPMSPSQVSKNLSAPEGYMEMGWVKNTTNSQIDSRLSANSTITISKNNNETNNTRHLNDSRPTSMPININQGKSNLNNERKNINLSLATKSTNPTTRVRCDSKDSGIMTPSGSHNAIFPFSPGSPSGHPPPFSTISAYDEQPPAPRQNNKTETATHLQRIPEPPEEMLVTKTEPTKTNNTDSAPSAQLEGLSSDYADMSLGTKKTTPTETVVLTKKLSSARTTTNADYTIMHPFPAKKPLLVTINNNLSNATTKTNITGFRPISNVSSASTTSNAGYELLQVRPNSVNSENPAAKTINTTNNRPSSANSDRLTATNSTPTPSTTTSSSSSASTICGGSGSKCQSPLSVQRVSSNDSTDSQSNQSTTSRPPSVSSERELHYASLDLPQNTTQSSERLEVDITIATEARTDSSSSPCSATTTGDAAVHFPPTFTYAQIDFIKSEQLKAAAKLAASASETTSPTTQPPPPQQPNASC